MRKVIINLAVSLDGFIEGPNGEYDWCFDDGHDYGLADFVSQVDAMFIGRRSFEMIQGDLALFPVQNYYVFSDTLEADDQPENVTIIRSESLDKQVEEILNEPGGNIWLFGGASLITALMNRNLVTEMVLSIHPIVLGAGTPLFKHMKDRVNLTLISQTAYETGLLQARYSIKPRFDADTMKLL